MSFVWPSYTCSLPDSARRFTDLPDETRASGALPSSAVAHLPNFAVYPVSSTDGPSEEDTSSLLGDMLRIAAVRSSVCRFILILPLSLEWRLLETINSLKILHVYRVVERTIFWKKGQSSRSQGPAEISNRRLPVDRRHRGHSREALYRDGHLHYRYR